MSPGSVPSHGLRTRQPPLLLLVLRRGGQSSALAAASPSAPKSWERLSPRGTRGHPEHPASRQGKQGAQWLGAQVDAQAGFPGTGSAVRGCRAHHPAIPWFGAKIVTAKAREEGRASPQSWMAAGPVCRGQEWPHRQRNARGSAAAAVPGGAGMCPGAATLTEDGERGSSTDCPARA